MCFIAFDMCGWVRVFLDGRSCVARCLHYVNVFEMGFGSCPGWCGDVAVVVPETTVADTCIRVLCAHAASIPCADGGGRCVAWFLVDINFV